MSHRDESYTGSLWEEFSEIDIADVVVDADAPDLLPSYSYRVPEALRNTLWAGACVHVPFAGRDLLGYVLERRKIPLNDPLCPRLKEIISIVQESVSINEEQLHIAQWMTERYVCDLLSAVRCVAPAQLGGRVSVTVRLRDPEMRGFHAGDSVPQAHLIEMLRSLGGETETETLKEQAQLPNFASAYSALLKKGIFLESRDVVRPQSIAKRVRAYRLGAAANTLGANSARKPTPFQTRATETLIAWSQKSDAPMPAALLQQEAQVSAEVLRNLAEKGVFESVEITVRRAPVRATGSRTTAPPLSEGQALATETLRLCIQSHEYAPTLLFGVTASGKTEVYLNAIAHTVAQGRSAIVLVPEIALTAQVVDVFIGRFGDQVAVLHSRLSEGERHDEWRRMQAGEAKIVVGARSAIFAPVSNVGLIVVDEEHEASYKQEKTPRYNARTLAMERARLSRATLLLGSATPSLESFYQSVAPAKPPHIAVPEFLDALRYSPFGDKLLRIEMRERIDNRPLPKVIAVDQRDDFKQRRALFSWRLTEAMADRLAKRQQIILFLNRRGYAQFVLCRDCGYVAKCPNCAVSLAFHLEDRLLHCHHCGFTSRPPTLCPDCKGMKVKAFGIGTEKVEEEVLRLFPQARVTRMDRDTTAKKGAHTRIVREFREGESDILIGTQMVAKGLDFPNVTLVGVISADTAINMPDFRAAERTFQLLTQVAGRAGRGATPGEVIVQTFNPEHYAVQAAIHHDYEAFYKQELPFRKELLYPPFARFANLICSDTDERQAEAKALALAEALTKTAPPDMEIIGPAAAPLSRLKSLFRFHVAIRARVDAPLSEVVRNALALLMPSDRLSVNVDIDPLNMT